MGEASVRRSRCSVGANQCEVVCSACSREYESIRESCCPGETLGSTRGKWSIDADQELLLRHRTSGGGCMLFCTISSAFFMLCAISLYIWDRQECSEYTWSGLVDGCAETGSADGDDDEAYAGITRSSTVRCADDYDCEFGGMCNLTASRCIYNDERINRGSFVALGLLCALLAALCGGAKGGCRQAFVRIDRMPEGEAGSWVLATEQKAWCCVTLQRSRDSLLPHDTRAHLVRCATTSGADIGWTVAVKAARPQQSKQTVPEDDVFAELAPEPEVHQVWHGKPLERHEAQAIVARVNHFLHPEEAAQAAAVKAASKKPSGARSPRSPRPPRPPRSPTAAQRGFSPVRPPRTVSHNVAAPRSPSTRAAAQRQVESTQQQLMAVMEAQHERDIVASQVSEARLVLKRAREHLGAMLADDEAEVGAVTTRSLRELRAELDAAQQRLKSEFLLVAGELEPKAAQALRLVESDMIRVEEKLEASEQADAAAHQLELLLSKQQLLQLLQDRPDAREDATQAIASIDQELRPGGKPIARRPRSPVVARARSPVASKLQLSRRPRSPSPLGEGPYHGGRARVP
jgi:hypothetical protein